MQISLAQEIAKSKEVENAQERWQLVPGDSFVQLSKCGIEEPPPERLATPRLIRIFAFPPQDEKGQQPDQGNKNDALSAAIF
jgi:hypothetical protein